MYYVRTYTSGPQSDPRSKIWAEFHCSVCGENSDIDVTFTSHTFQFDRERKCTHCGNLNPDDKVLNLKAQKEKLEADKVRITKEIEKLCTEIEQCETSAVKGN